MCKAVTDGSSTTTDRGIADVLSGREELACYKALQVPAKHSTPLIFRRENAVAVEFPGLLSEVARRVLCISASSAQSERNFSSVGRTITDARARLSPSTV